ncbi:helix-turn-helix domain-containing protein [Phenylobacterium sp.]|uniref:helix-turn-helix domain-containing protein n=1 Tax=Phenylobacterium sp. TaxID=1871053 RepID=UPI0039449849
MSRLPGILGEIARVAGASAATRLACAAGGTEMKFSAHPGAALAKIVGAEAAKAIVAELGPEKYVIPMAHLRGQKGRQAAAAEMLAQGASANVVAKACDVHERTARRVRKRMLETRALPLFPDE